MIPFFSLSSIFHLWIFCQRSLDIVRIATPSGFVASQKILISSSSLYPPVCIGVCSTSLPPLPPLLWQLVQESEGSGGLRSPRPPASGRSPPPPPPPPPPRFQTTPLL